MVDMRNLLRLSVSVGLWVLVALSAYSGSPALQPTDHLLYLPLVSRNEYGPLPPTRMGYGLVVADVQNLKLVRDLGFGWAQVFVPWAAVEPEESGPRRWGAVDDLIKTARRYNVRLLARVDRPPDWAREPGTSPTGPVRRDRLDRWAGFLEALAQRGAGVIQAYEIWNEPNLSWEWGGLLPDPPRYVEILRTAYAAIKRGDPNAVVVAAAMATTGPRGEDPIAWDDLLYIERMYQAGAKEFFDALGTNPHGFGYPPEQDPGAVNGLAFRRVEQQRQIMERYGDTSKGMWAMEVGWLSDPGPVCYPLWEQWGRLWQKVSLEQQRDYLVRAFQYAWDHWPWMEVMVVFNLDFGAVPEEAGCPGATNVCRETRFYALVTRDNPCDADDPLRFRPAYEALKAMPKR